MEEIGGFYAYLAFRYDFTIDTLLVKGVIDTDLVAVIKREIL